MKIYDFVEWELEEFRQKCNFSADELAYFNLRAKHYSNLEIAIKMNISEGKVSKLAKSVKQKILKEMMRNARSEEERESYRKTIEQLQR